MFRCHSADETHAAHPYSARTAIRLNRFTMSCELSAVIAAGLEVCKPIETNGKIRNWFVFGKKTQKPKTK